MIPRPDEAPEPVAEINTTPLIDVLLVLLVMLILIIPEPTRGIALRLPPPDASGAPPAERVTLTIDDGGAVAWNGAPVGDLEARLAALAGVSPRPQLVLVPAPEAAYRHLVNVMGALQRHGLGPVVLAETPP